VYNPNAPRPIEVFRLSEAANAAIPEDIREQFHCDDSGHVLFFSAPPLDIAPSLQQKLGHSLKYLAAKEERRKLVEQRKRKEDLERVDREERVKRLRADEETDLAVRVEALTAKAVDIMTSHVMVGTEKIYEHLYSNRAETAKQADAEARARRIIADRITQEKTAQIQAYSSKATAVSLKGSAMYMDDIDPRI
jgi:chromatin structure-remodeling complex subunit RSC1/2